MCAWLSGFAFNVEFSENHQARSSYIKIPDLKKLDECRGDYQPNLLTSCSYLDRASVNYCDTTFSQESSESEDYLTPIKSADIRTEEEATATTNISKANLEKTFPAKSVYDVLGFTFRIDPEILSDEAVKIRNAKLLYRK